MTDDKDEPTPGWDAIDAALRPIYGAVEPKHYATIIPAALGGPDPLDGISAYKRDGAIPHWHFVTYGFTELYAKETDDPDVSGYGFELTFRLARQSADEEPPVWACNMLQNLARYVFRSGNAFAPGHHMTLNGPIAAGVETDVTAALFAADPELPATTSANGQLTFVQVVGITDDELEAVQGWNSAAFTELLSAADPLLITALARKSILADPQTARVVAERTERDGSSLGELFITTARWKRIGLLGKAIRLTVDAHGATSLIRQLRGRLPHRRPLLLTGRGGQAENVTAFKPDDASSTSITTEGFLAVSLTPSAAREMSEGLLPKRGLYRWEALKNFEIEVVPTEIKDGQGNIIRVVG